MTDDGTADVAESNTAADSTDDAPTVIRTGRNFDAEFHLDAEAAGQFLVDLGDQLQTDDELTLETAAWKLPFRFGEPVDVEIDFEGVGDPELEIEVELRGQTDQAPNVE